MPLSEREELELLTLERERAQAQPEESLFKRTVKSGAQGLLRGGPLGMAMGLSAPAEEMYSKAAYNVGGKVTDLTKSPELGYAANVAMQAIPTFAAGGLAKAALSPAMESGARSLMQSAIKPSVGDLQTGKAARAIVTLLREGISPNKGGIDKLRTLTAELDKEVSQAIAGSTSTISKGAVGTRLLDTWNKFKAQVNPDADLETIKNAWSAFRSHPDLAGKQNIPVQLAQELKRGTYARLGEKAYGEVGTSSREAQKALARGLREEVGTAVPEVRAAMARQAELMNAVSVAERRALMEGNKNPIGLGPMATTPIGFASFLADRSLAIKSALARALYSGQKQVPSNAARLAAMLAVTPQATEE